MAYEIGFTDNAGAEGLAHWEFLLKVKALAEANGWVTLRYDDVSAVRELILQGEGLDGAQEIFVGLRAYHNVAADVYNISVAGFTGYVAANAFTAQPGYFESGIPAHNNRIDYWLAVNAQRIAFGLKVGTPVYEHGYAGFFLPYATPSQYPYPLAVGGMLTATPETRFSDTAHSMYLRGNRGNFKMRAVDGTWKQVDCYPWTAEALTQGGTSNWLTGTTASVRDTGDTYPLLAAVLSDNGPNIYGELDGVRHISGFNNAVENTLTIDTVPWVVMQDVGRTGFPDYYALRLD